MSTLIAVFYITSCGVIARLISGLLEDVALPEGSTITKDWEAERKAKLKLYCID